MNIVVRTYSGRTVFRPDTTLEPFNRDYYPPEYVSSLEFSRVVYVRISRPGKSIATKFAGRYYDSFGRGVLMYPTDLLDGSEEGFACALCLDHTSVLPMPARELSGMSAYEHTVVDQALSDISDVCLVRTGDILAVELSPRAHLASRENGTTPVEEGDCRYSVIF